MITYTVLPGDTLWRIALMFGVELNNLLLANPNISNQNFIYPGQIINIPSEVNTSTYIIKKGDTMWNIAHKYRIPLNVLLTVNPQIKDPSLIYPGQIINIPSEANVPGVPNLPSENDDLRDLEKEVIRLVNIERSKVGQSPLTENNKLSNVARIKSEDFINNNYFDHNSPIYGSPSNMLKRFNINSTATAENIASGQRTAKEVMNTWMSSPGHRENILNGIYNQIGVGVVRESNGNLYWTQMFIRN